MAGLFDSNLNTESEGPGLSTEGSAAHGILEENSVEEREALKRKSEATSLVRTKKETRQMKGQDTGILNTSTSLVPEWNLDTGLGPLKTDIPDYPKIAGTDFDSVESSVYDKDGWGFNTLDFLFGSEAAVVGIAHDADGFSWNLDNLKQQWSEQPIWVNALSTASLVGTMLIPAGLAARSVIKTGGLATKAMQGTIKETAEISRWIDNGLVEKGIKTYSDIVGGQQTISEIRRLEMATTAAAKRMKRAAAVEAGEITWKNPVERSLHEFEKRFSNTYFEAINGNPADGKHTLREQFHDRLDKLWKREEVGQMLSTMPDESKGVALSAYLMSKLDPGVAARVAQDGTAKGLSKTDKAWADMYWEWEKRGQARRLESGFINQETFDRIGEGHIAALSKATPDANFSRSTTHMVPINRDTLKGARKQKAAAGLVEVDTGKTGLFGQPKSLIEPVGEYDYVPVQLIGKVKLDSPTLLHRAGTHDEVYDRLISGRMISAPGDLTAHGYLTSEMLHDNFQFITELAVNPNYIATADDIALFAGDSAKAAKAGFVKLDYAGDGAAATLRRMISKKTGQPEEALPYLRKHVFDEIFGPNGMMNQTTHAANNFMGVATTIFKTMKTGFSIPTHLQNTGGNLAFISQAGMNITDPKNIAMLGELKHTFNKIADVSKAAKKYNMGGKSMFDPDGMLKGINLGKIDVPMPNGKMKSFNLNEEFFNNPVMKEILEESSFHSAESAGHLDEIAATLGQKQYLTKGLVKTYAKAKNVAQIGDKAKWMDWMTTQYLAEDMVPKMGLYLHFRAKGMTQKAAATLVARRLPMYNTVGSSISLGRKWAFPWATFSTEAARITKNNIMDHPIRMMPWLRAPQIMQSMASGAGFAPETRAEAEAAEKQLPFWAQKGTTVITEGKAGAGASGAALGGLAGGFLGGFSGGGATGVKTGVAVGAAAGGLLAAMTTDEDHAKQLRGALQDWLPHSTFTLSNTSAEFGGELVPWQDMAGMIEQSPIEPMAILQPMLAIMKGEDQFGRPVDPEVGGGLAKTIAGAIGFLSPPIIQKYGFKITTPQTSLPGDPTGVTNVNRLLIDTGNAIDPMTGLPGSMNMDFFVNNLGLWKSYAASGPQQLANESKTEKHMQDVRNHISRNLAFHLENGNDKEVVKLLSRVQGTFAQQYASDPRTATNKYGEWLERYAKAIGTHPKLRNWSEDELKERLAISLFTQGEARSAARNNMLQALRDELTVRGGGSYHGDMFAPEDLSVDLGDDLEKSIGLGKGKK